MLNVIITVMTWTIGSIVGLLLGIIVMVGIVYFGIKAAKVVMGVYEYINMKRY